MLTTLSIVSLDQGKIAPRHDFQPKPASELDALAAPETATQFGRLGHLVLAIRKEVSARLGHRKSSAVSHA